MKTNTREKIIAYIKDQGKTRIYDMVHYLEISAVAVHKQIRRLLEEKKIEKIGKPPMVFYQIRGEKPSTTEDKKIPSYVEKAITDNYLYISPIGEQLYGLVGFKQWCINTKQERQFVPLTIEYAQYRKKLYAVFKKENLIDATKKIQQTFHTIWIDRLYYFDFYSLPRFGKTKLGQLVLYAKQSQNIPLIQKIVKLTCKKIKTFINKHHIDAIAFIPHTIPRKAQFLKEFERLLDLYLPKIGIVKAYKNNLYIAQKSLSKLEDRVYNARETIVIIKSQQHYKNILLFDDAAGSGASMNETAKKLKDAGIATKNVYGLVIVGSMKGFDVINEV